MHPWLLATLGGVLIGGAAVLLMACLGRIAGISGIAAALIRPGLCDRSWRLAFVLGLLAAPMLLWLLRGDSGIGQPMVAPPWMALAGVLVGFGTGLGSGCTSGHGVCGIARLSRRSLLATGVFLACGVGTVYVVRHLLGGL
ncbi:MAG: YeeE/YedE family protein [Rhodanobacter sp.]|jgi:hypothetical protein